MTLAALGHVLSALGAGDGFQLFAQLLMHEWLLLSSRGNPLPWMGMFSGPPSNQGSKTTRPPENILLEDCELSVLC